MTHFLNAKKRERERESIGVCKVKASPLGASQVCALLFKNERVEKLCQVLKWSLTVHKTF